MTICWLVRSMLTKTGSWHCVGRDLESCHGLWKVYIYIYFSYVLLVVLCLNMSVCLFGQLKLHSAWACPLSNNLLYHHPPWAPMSVSGAANAINTSCQLNMGHIKEAIGKGIAFLYACPVAPPTQPIESGGVLKAMQAIQQSGLQHHTQCRPAILWLLWPNILPLPTSMTIGTFLWMRWPYQTRMLLIILHPLPGMQRATDLGMQHLQHLLCN